MSQANLSPATNPATLPPASGFQLDTWSGVGKQLAYNLTMTGTGALVDSAINGTDLKDGLTQALRGGVGNTIGAVGFYYGANFASNLNLPEGSVGRALMHAATGAATGKLINDDAAGGAAGAFVASLFAPGIGSLTHNNSYALALGDLAGTLGAVALTGNLDSAETGQATGRLVTQYNYLSHKDIDELNQKLRQCKNDDDCLEDARAWMRQRDADNLAAQNACATDECRLAHAIARESGNQALLDSKISGYLSLTPGIRSEIEGLQAGDKSKLPSSLNALATVVSFASVHCGGAWDASCKQQWDTKQAQQSTEAKALVAALYAPAALATGTEAIIALRGCLASRLCINELGIGITDTLAGDATGGVSLGLGAGATAKTGMTVANSLDGQAPKLANDAIEAALRLEGKAALISELPTGTKITFGNVVDIRKLPDGRIVWLETGSEAAGLQHIYKRHEIDFTNKGISRNDIPIVVMNALERGKIIGTNGTANVYSISHNGIEQNIAIGVGSNGFIVRANPVNSWRPLP